MTSETRCPQSSKQRWATLTTHLNQRLAFWGDQVGCEGTAAGVDTTCVQASTAHEEQPVSAHAPTCMKDHAPKMIALRFAMDAAGTGRSGSGVYDQLGWDGVGISMCGTRRVQQRLRAV